MTDKEFAKGNETIMKYDGWKLTTRYTFDPDHNGGKNDYKVYVKEGIIAREITCRPEDIEYDIVYHKSWDALMGVVEKINKAGKMVTINLWTEVEATECKIYNWGVGEPQNEAEEKEPIIAVWKAVVAHIEWLNNEEARLTNLTERGE